MAMKCYETRKCFGQVSPRTGMRMEVCFVLTTTYPDKECPFCKPDRYFTNGKFYPPRREE